MGMETETKYWAICDCCKDRRQVGNSFEVPAGWHTIELVLDSVKQFEKTCCLTCCGRFNLAMQGKEPTRDQLRDLKVSSDSKYDWGIHEPAGVAK